MSGPALALVAGAVTAWIAFSTKDSLVVDDYYKQGLAINKVLRKEEVARSRGIAADIVIEPRTLKIRLTGDAPPALFVQLLHATLAGHDMKLRLAPAAPGVYQAALPPLPPGHWRVVVEDARGEWRIAREVP